MSRLKKMWAEKYKELMIKGHERVTVMVIPHGEKHIFNLQLSKITIVFAMITVVAIIIASALSYQLQEDIRVEVDSLHDTRRAVYHEREQYIQKFIEMTEKQRRFKESVIALYQMANIDDSQLFIEEDVLLERAQEQMQLESQQVVLQYQKLKAQKEQKQSSLDLVQAKLLPASDEEEAQVDEQFEYHPEVVAYRRLHLDLISTINSVKVLRNFLVEREVVQNNLPYSWPLSGGHFTSFYGLRANPTGYSSEFHTGVDLAKSRGSAIFATADGIVKGAGHSGGYGKRVRLTHRFGYETIYAHMANIHVRVGQAVKKGQLIGRVGSTGRTTGPHLHYEVRVAGKTVNPMRFLSAI